MSDEQVKLPNMTYSRQDKPLGITWEEWTAKWWQWVISIPREKNPGLDVTGEKFIENQDDKEVLFLVGNYEGVIS